MPIKSRIYNEKAEKDGIIFNNLCEASKFIVIYKYTEMI